MTLKKMNEKQKSDSLSYARHNHGLTLIQSALKPYHGKIYTDICNGIYITEIVIPLKESRRQLFIMIVAAKPYNSKYI